MSWTVAVREILNSNESGSGRFRKTVYNEKSGEGPWGDLTHDHLSVEEADSCPICSQFCLLITDGKT